MEEASRQKKLIENIDRTIHAFSMQRINSLISFARYCTTNGQLIATTVALMHRCQMPLTDLLNLRWQQIDLILGFLFYSNPSRCNFMQAFPLYQSDIACLKMLEHRSELDDLVFSTNTHSIFNEYSLKKNLVEFLVQFNAQGNEY